MRAQDLLNSADGFMMLLPTLTALTDLLSSRENCTLPNCSLITIPTPPTMYTIKKEVSFASNIPSTELSQSLTSPNSNTSELVMFNSKLATCGFWKLQTTLPLCNTLKTLKPAIL